MYIYKTTNLKNNKVYIGKSEKDIDENPEYLGSGKILKRAVKKYGRDNFKKEILFETDDVEILNEQEIHYISYYKTKFGDQCYNIANGGQGGNSLRYYSDEELIKFKEKMSKLVTGEANPFYGKHHTDETKQLISKKNRGFKHTDEFKKNCSERMLNNTINIGRKYSEERKKQISELTSGKNNPMYGKTHSIETLEKISKNIIESKKIKIECEYCHKEVDKGNYNRWHGDNCKNNPNITMESLQKRKPWNKK